jgi:hypothetical protein
MERYWAMELVAVTAIELAELVIATTGFVEGRSILPLDIRATGRG